MAYGLIKRGRNSSSGVIRTIKKFSAYRSISVPPGELPKETQSAINPINQDSVVLLIGASRGIGLEFVDQLLKKGCSVIATHRGKVVPPSLSALSCDKLTFLEMDVGEDLSIRDASIVLKNRIGRSLTHVIHNAGIISREGLGQVNAAEMLECFKINSIGPMLTAQCFTPLLFREDGNPPIFAILTSKVGSIDDNESYVYIDG